MIKSSEHAILLKLGIEKLNDMQQEAKQVIEAKSDVVLLSPTGSGKTLAFLLPIMTAMIGTHHRLLLIVPSRELALQTESVARKMAMGFYIQCCYGGHNRRAEIEALKGKPAIIIGTPGRLEDHLRNGNLGTDFSYLVLDEYDKSIETGFEKEMTAIVESLPFEKQTILTSATMAKKIPKFIDLKETITIDYEQQSVKNKLLLRLVHSPTVDKLPTLLSLIKDVLPESSIVFCNYKASVDRVSAFLTENGIENGIFHGGLDQLEREVVLSKFRNGSIQTIISTDLASRGLDIPFAENIIHYHFPHKEDAFIHRNGRTARMGASGKAFILVSEKENIPEFIYPIPNSYYPDEQKFLKTPPVWTTIKLNKGRKDKISKGDLAGFFLKNSKLSADELGLIEIKDQFSLVAIPQSQSEKIMLELKEQTLKGKTVKLSFI